LAHQSEDNEADADTITAFPFTEMEVLWAFSNFNDAYGPVMRRQEANFRRCACVDNSGRRKPWQGNVSIQNYYYHKLIIIISVPPAIGFMSRRPCVLFKVSTMHKNNDTLVSILFCHYKMRLVRSRDRQERQWQQYKTNALADAVKRAEFDAMEYLESAQG